eukprot:SAG31_NODE_4385_length_3281_cov_137.482401_2_plen_127_part_00
MDIFFQKLDVEPRLCCELPKHLDLCVRNQGLSAVTDSSKQKIQRFRCFDDMQLDELLSSAMPVRSLCDAACNKENLPCGKTGLNTFIASDTLVRLFATAAQMCLCSCGQLQATRSRSLLSCSPNHP